MFQSKSSRLLIIFCAMFLMMVGCKTDPKADTSATTEDEKFTVISHLGANPNNLNPYLTTSSYNRQVFHHIFSNIVHYDTKTLELSPMLVKEVPKAVLISDGENKGRFSLTYEIHDEATWDDGTPVTGHDVDFSLKVLMNPKVQAAPYRAVAASYFDIVIDEANPKKFTMIGDDYFLLDYIFTDIPIIPTKFYDPKGLMKNFTLKELAILDKELKGEGSKSKSEDLDPRLEEFADEFHLEKYSREKEFINGCGAYQLEEWVTGQRVVLKKKENWWGKDLGIKFPLLEANPETIIFRYIKDPTITATELKSGSLDAISVLRSQELVELKKSTLGQEKLNFHSPVSYLIYYLGINNNVPKLSDKRVRKAIAHVINMDKVLENIVYGYGERIVSDIHPHRKYFNKKLKPVSYDVDKAISLLKEAGWEDSNDNGIVDKMIDGELTELRIDYKTSPGGIGEQLALLMKPDAKRAGIDINIVTKDFNIIRADLKKRDYELFVSGWSQDPSLNDLYQNWHTDSDTPSGGNKFGFGNATSDDIIEKIRNQNTSPEERTNLYHQFQEIIYDEQPCIFLYAGKGRMAVSKKFDYTPSTRKPGIFENQFKLAK